MKVRLCLVALLSTHALYGVYGKSFLTFKPSFAFNDPERRALLDVYGEKGLLQATIFGGRTCDEQELGRYYLPDDAACMRIAEDGSSSFRGSQVTAAFMNIITEPIKDKATADFLSLVPDMTYSSSVLFCPRRSEVGAGFVARYDFCRRDWGDVWAMLATSVVQLRHSLNISERILNSGGTGPDSGYGYKTLCAMISAGCPQWNYGKFCGGCLKKTGVPEVEVTLGHDHINEELGVTQSFLGVTIPTGSKVCQRYMFEPVVGNGRHVTVFGGVAGNYTVESTKEADFNFAVSGLLRYTCAHDELRSFDLKNKPWSRYMLVWKNDDALSNPAVAANVTEALDRMAPLINYSTLCVSVEPKWSLDVNAALQYERTKFSCELGYHGYARQAEDTCLCNACMTSGLGLQAFTNYLREWEVSDDTPKTRSFDSINSRVFSAASDLVDYSYIPSSGTYPEMYVPITVDSLDKYSALTPAALVHTVYGTLAYQCGSDRVPVKLLVGALYRSAVDNSAPHDWKVWGTIAFAF